MSQPGNNTLQRRRYLVTAGAVVGSVGLAGCMGEGDESSNEEDSETNSTDTPESAPEESEASPEPGVEIINSDVSNRPRSPDGDSEDVAWLRLDVRNPLDTIHRDVEIQARFRDNDGDIIETGEYGTDWLPANTTWVTYSRHNFELSEFSEAEVMITNQEVGMEERFDRIEQYEILNETMNFKEGQGVFELSGEIQLTGESSDRIIVYPLVYDSDGQFRGSFNINVSNTEPTAAFDGGLVGFITPDGESEPSDYELIVIAV